MRHSYPLQTTIFQARHTAILLSSCWTNDAGGTIRRAPDKIGNVNKSIPPVIKRVTPVVGQDNDVTAHASVPIFWESRRSHTVNR